MAGFDLKNPVDDQGNVDPMKFQARPENFVTATSLGQLDMDAELLHAYTEARFLYEAVKGDLLTPLNQKSQLLVAIARIQSEIVKTQQALHNVQTMKIMEMTLIEVLKNHEAISEDFLRDYRYALRKHFDEKKREAAAA